MPTVGWIGLGAMGAPMAACTARAGLTVTAFDIDPGRAQALEHEGIRAAASGAEAAAGMDVLVMMVASEEQLHAALFDGPSSAAAALDASSIVVVMSTVGPAAVQEVERRLAKQDIALVDAPVSGGVRRAVRGELLIFTAGADHALKRVRPLLDAMADSAEAVGGEVGEGQKVKLVNQLLCGVHIAAAGEALALAEAIGLDGAATRELVRSGAAASFMLDDRGQRMVDSEFDEVRSALDIFVKDLGLVCETARQHGQPSPVTAAAHQLFLTGSNDGMGRLDDSSVIEVLRGSQRGRPKGTV